MENFKLLLNTQWTVFVEYESENMAVLNQGHHLLNICLAATIQNLLKKGCVVVQMVC